MKRERVSRSVASDSLRPQGWQPARLPCPWNSPGKNTGVGCHFLLQGIFPTHGSNQGLWHCRQTVHWMLAVTRSPYILWVVTCSFGPPWWLSCKESTWQCRRHTGSIPGSGNFPGEGNGSPLQYSCLENPMDRGAWPATVQGVIRVSHNLATKQQQKYKYITVSHCSISETNTTL